MVLMADDHTTFSARIVQDDSTSWQAASLKGKRRAIPCGRVTLSCLQEMKTSGSDYFAGAGRARMRLCISVNRNAGVPTMSPSSDWRTGRLSRAYHCIGRRFSYWSPWRQIRR
jgi:hypothetical protein